MRSRRGGGSPQPRGPHSPPEPQLGGQAMCPEGGSLLQALTLPRPGPDHLTPARRGHLAAGTFSPGGTASLLSPTGKDADGRPCHTLGPGLLRVRGRHQPPAHLPRLLRPPQQPSSPRTLKGYF